MGKQPINGIANDFRLVAKTFPKVLITLLLVIMYDSKFDGPHEQLIIWLTRIEKSMWECSYHVKKIAWNQI